MLAYTRIGALAKKDGTLSEKIGGRGEGSILYEGRQGRVHVWFRYTHEGKRRRVQIGVLEADTTLKAAREKGRQYAESLAEHPDLKGWIELEEARQREAQEVERRRIEQAQRQGTLVDLLEDYRADLARKGKASATEVRRIIKREILGANPALAAKRACDVEPADIVAVLKPIWDRGAHVLHNRVRSFLHAAFRYGAAAEYDVARASDKRYGLLANPVALVPHQKDAETPGTVALPADQLRRFYGGITEAPSVGVVIGSFLRLCIATGGQRPAQLLRATWDAYDFEQRFVRIEDRKGRGGLRVHLVPLTDRALDLLALMRVVNADLPWPFTVSGTAPINITSLKNAINRFRAVHPDIIDFTARDLRRTCKQLAMRHGVSARLMNVLQGHELGGLVGRHYANDPETWLPEKWEAMRAFDAVLTRVLGDVPAAMPSTVPANPSVHRGHF